MINKTKDPISCGRRIKSARLLAGFSRRQFEDFSGISSSTIQSWEIGRNPLSEKMAKILMEYFGKAGLICSVEWLLHAVGSPPKTVEELNYLSQKQDDSNNSIEIINWSDEFSIQKDVENFYRSNKDAIVILINDDGMEPYYSRGDYVGGKKINLEYLDKLYGVNCIIQTDNEDIFVRQIRPAEQKQQVNIFCINPNTTVSDPVKMNVPPKFLAPVIWHRKPDIFNKIYENGMKNGY